MELKPYQQTVLNDLDEYLNCIQQQKNHRFDVAFNKFWEDKIGIFNPLEGKGMEPYKNTLAKAPQVTIKVPTAGGKTFIASHALNVIFNHFDSEIPKAVVWLVPSITILDQTIKNLSNPVHPYRLCINTHFNSRVEVYKKDDLLSGAGFNPTSVKEQLSIFILSFDSLRSKKKEDRKFYQQNGQLAPFAELNSDTSHILEGTEETALINIIRNLKPVVIVDEAHGAVSDLSVEMLANLNPSFILDLTATPRNNSNIISFVDAFHLKKENMVKLPVIVYNHHDRNGVIESAINLQKKLEIEAKKEEENGGSYIRPIVLFQAQPKTDDDNTTFEKIKQILIDLKIPENQIKIKTAAINEIKDIDLMAKDCEVRYIITVNALKEGWDCPFAYILASLAEKSSQIDIEQIVGRILRQPYVKRHKFDLLNCSFVITASNKFRDTLQVIVDGLNKAGFSSKDFKVAVDESVEEQQQEENVFRQLTIQIPEQQETTPSQTEETPIDKEVDTSKINIVSENTTIPNEVLEKITQKATEASAEMDKLTEELGDDASFTLPAEIQQKVKVYKIKETFADSANKIKLPQFYLNVPSNPLFPEHEADSVLLSKEALLENFKLSQEDIKINFDSIFSELYKVDLEEGNKGEYSPTFSQIEGKIKEPLVEYLLAQPKDTQIAQITGRIAKLIGNMWPIADKEINTYIKRILESLNSEQISDLVTHELTYKDKIKDKIKQLSEKYAESQFNKHLDTDKITIKDNFTFKSSIIPARLAPAITKSLYEHESEMNDFEAQVINEIANLSNIAYWHRNIEKSGFYLNGFINHYPDFIVQTKSGKTLIIESKGDYLDNEDSKAKIRLGQKWQGKAGNKYRYFMVFDQKQVEGAYKIDDLINVIKEI